MLTVFVLLARPCSTVLVFVVNTAPVEVTTYDCPGLIKQRKKVVSETNVIYI